MHAFRGFHPIQLNPHLDYIPWMDADSASQFASHVMLSIQIESSTRHVSTSHILPRLSNTDLEPANSFFCIQKILSLSRQWCPFPNSEP